MFTDSQELNKSDLIFRNKAYEENRLYFNTTIKKIKNKKYSESNEQNLLIDCLKDFSVKYEFDDKIIPKSQKFVITFDQLISLIRFSLQSQIKLANCLKVDLENSKNLSEEFINNLTNYINSYEKVEKINPNIKRKSSEKENIGIIANNVKKNKSINQMNKSSSYWIAGKKSIKKDNKKDNRKKNMKKEEKIEQTNLKKKNNRSNNNFIKTSNSYIRGNLAQKLISPKNNKNKEKNKKFETKPKNLLNRSVDRRHKAILSDLSPNDKNHLSKINNKSSEKRKIRKPSNNKRHNKTLSIYTACENLRSTSFLFKNNKNKGFSTENFGKEDINYNFEKKEEGNKIIYYNKSMILGVKKQIINSNVIKPSSFANKLLQNGRKYITEFNGIKEAERKKQY